MHLLLSAHGDDRALLDELARRWPWAIPTQERPGLIAVEGDSSEPQPLLPLVFARQLLPHAQRCELGLNRHLKQSSMRSP